MSRNTPHRCASGQYALWDSLSAQLCLWRKGGASHLKTHPHAAFRQGPAPHCSAGMHANLKSSGPLLIYRASRCCLCARAPACTVAAANWYVRGAAGCSFAPGTHVCIPGSGCPHPERSAPEKRCSVVPGAHFGNLQHIGVRVLEEVAGLPLLDFEALRVCAQSRQAPISAISSTLVSGSRKNTAGLPLMDLVYCTPAFSSRSTSGAIDCTPAAAHQIKAFSSPLINLITQQPPHGVGVLHAFSRRSTSGATDSCSISIAES